MSINQNFPNVWPSLVLDFENSKTLDPRISFGRSSTATYVGSNGLIKTAPVDEARFDHDPVTGESLGLLIEESRTNLITRSTATGATNGVIGSGGALPSGWNFDQMQPGITVEIIGSGTEKGLTYVDIRFSGTPTTTNRTLIRPGSFFTINGETYYLTAYSKLVSGTNNLSHTNFDYGALSLTSELKRNTGAIRSGLTGTFYPRFDIGMNAVGQPCDITIRFAAPQMELGAFSTSYIPTSGSAVTREPDITKITGTNFSSWYNQNEGTIVYESALTHFPRNLAYKLLFSINAGTGGQDNVIHALAVESSTIVLSAIWNNSSPQYTQYSRGLSNYVANDLKFTIGYKDNDVRSYMESAGFLDTVADNNVTIPKSMVRFDIGHVLDNRHSAKQHVKQIRYYPERLTNDQLQNLTK